MDTAPTQDFAARLRDLRHDPRDPDPFLALYLDHALPLDPQAKAALVLDVRSFSRQVLHRVLKPLARVAIALIGLAKVFLPTVLTSSKLLHKSIRWGLQLCVSPQANFLVLRHFHVASEVVAFIAANAPVRVETRPLRPRTLADVEDDLFLQHDLNLFNFVIRLNTALRDAGERLRPPPRLDFGMITDGPFDLAPLPERWTNALDLASAIELYTPMYQAFLTDDDFGRAVYSLQLDETVAIYAASLLGDATHLALVNNHHPLVPLSAFKAAHRLMLHGLASECLHALLVHHKRLQRQRDAEGLPPDAARGGLGALLGLQAHVAPR